MKKPFLLLITTYVGMLLGANAQKELSPNLIRNSYMNILDGNKPAGYVVDGNLTIEAVHPYTKGFEGPYWETPGNSATSVDAATEQMPFNFGKYYKGPRTDRGGLADGWWSMSDGKILKITGNNAGPNTSLFFPFEQNIGGNAWRFRAWVKIVSADFIAFGIDAGWANNLWGNRIVSKAEADQAQDGWFYIDVIVRDRKVTRLGSTAFSMGIQGNNIEVYLALPYLTEIDESQAWLPSVSDMLSRDGVNIHPITQNVGIGTTDTKGYKLAVNGSAVFTQAVVKNYNNWPDYVFDSSYQLPSLDRVEDYIKAYKHLPNIPAASEIKNKGLDLGDMSQKQQAKIEELTLYLIELKKRNELLEKRNELLEKRVEKLEHSGK